LTKPLLLESHALASCTLSSLEAEDAVEISRVLSSMDPWRRLGYRPEQLRSYLVREDPALKRYAVRVAGDKAGVLCVRHPWLLGPYNELLAVYPPFQGRSLGREVLGWMEEQYRAAARNIWTTVSSFNTGARRFYAGLGFTEVAPLYDLIEHGYDEILLRKKLTPMTPSHSSR
jgi:diamine N-acetyltransferase